MVENNNTQDNAQNNAQNNTENKGAQNNAQSNSNNKNIIPKELKDKNINKTVVRSLSKIIADKLLALQDLATLEVNMPVVSRMRVRMKTIRKEAAARSIKIKGHWKTIAPSMFIINLKGTKISNDESEITFAVYETDKSGNKKLYSHKSIVELADGKKVERVTSQEYKIAYEVKETIRIGKSIEREIIKLDVVN